MHELTNHKYYVFKQKTSIRKKLLLIVNRDHHIVLYIGIMKVRGFWPEIITPKPA